MKKKISGNRNLVVKISIIIVAVILVGYCAVSLISNFADIGVLKNNKAEKQEELSDINSDNEHIKNILDSENKDEYIEDEARDKGYIKDGDVPFYNSSDE